MNADLLASFWAGFSVDMRSFAPELWICFSIVFMLLIRLVPRYDKLHVGVVALALASIALVIALLQWPFHWTDLFGGDSEGVGKYLALFNPRNDPKTANDSILFGGMLVFDNFAIFIKIFLYGFIALVVMLTLLTRIPDKDDSADFYTLLFGSTLGMSLMASANHLLIVFIGIEMASVPSYAMAGFLKGRRQSSEAALKYVVYGGGASGVMLYGISLLAGRFGSGYLPTVMTGMAEGTALAEPSVALGITFLLLGLGFKLAAFPFHFWCPDVFEGAAAEVGAFLSVASKGAALALLARIVLGLSVFPSVHEAAAFETRLDNVGKEMAASDKGVKTLKAKVDDDEARGKIIPKKTKQALEKEMNNAAALRNEAGRLERGVATWSHAADYLVPVLAIFAVITMTFGNLAAFAQTNLKRLLAYSTIAHAGFMMMGLATMSKEGAGAVLFYLIVYLFMNLGAFAIVAFLRNLTGHEDLSYFRGFIYRSPLLVIMLGVFLLSLLGLPPLAGFMAKFQIFQVLYDSAQEYDRAGKPHLGWIMYGLLLAGGLNSVLSLFYYVKVLKVMVLERTLEEVENRPVMTRPAPVMQGIYATGLALVIFVLGVIWNPLAVASSQTAIDGFRPARLDGGKAPNVDDPARMIKPLPAPPQQAANPKKED